MIYQDKVKIIIKEKKKDGYGGYTEKDKVICTISCKVAPYTVIDRDVLKALNPWTSLNFYTQDTIPLDEDDMFFLEYKGKTYRKAAIVDYGKCIKVVGERYNLYV